VVKAVYKSREEQYAAQRAPAAFAHPCATRPCTSVLPPVLRARQKRQRQQQASFRMFCPVRAGTSRYRPPSSAFLNGSQAAQEAAQVVRRSTIQATAGDGRQPRATSNAVASAAAKSWRQPSRQRVQAQCL